MQIAQRTLCESETGNWRQRKDKIMMSARAGCECLEAMRAR
jgi:hypothetical protein